MPSNIFNYRKTCPRFPGKLKLRKGDVFNIHFLANHVSSGFVSIILASLMIPSKTATLKSCSLFKLVKLYKEAKHCLKNLVCTLA